MLTLLQTAHPLVSVVASLSFLLPNRGGVPPRILPAVRTVIVISPACWGQRAAVGLMAAAHERALCRDYRRTLMGERRSPLIPPKKGAWLTLLL